jgi:hypothetical protein
MHKPIPNHSSRLRKALKAVMNRGVVFLSLVPACAGMTAVAASSGSVVAASHEATQLFQPSAQSQACTPSAITTASVNLRTGPSTNYAIIATMPPAVQVPVTGKNANGSWYQVVYNGQQGWAAAQYLLTSCVGGVPVVNAPSAPAAPTPAPTPPPAQPGVSFTASATTVPFGQCTTLYWSVQTSGQVYLGYGSMLVSVPLASSQQVCPALSTLFYLRVVEGGAGQNYPLNVTVTNNPNNPANFRSNAYVVTPGQCPTLSWNVNNVAGVYLYLNSTQAQGVAGNATQQVCVSQPSNYGLKVVYNNGQEIITPLTINILNQPPANVVLIANPTTVQPGGCTQLQWLAGNARVVYLLDSSTGSKSKVGSVGNIQVCPSKTAVYTIQATLVNGSTAQQSQTVNVAAAQPTPVPLATPVP